MKIVVGNKKYSSWSLRGWLALKLTGAPFEEMLVPLDMPDTAEHIRRVSPSGRVPALIDGELTVWDSLAIGEYLHEKFPGAGLWPADASQRARARSISAEMHAGFANLRNDCTVRIVETRPYKPLRAQTQADVDRIAEIWEECLRKSGGPWLFGARPCIADVFYAPVVSRFRTYSTHRAAPSKCIAIPSGPGLHCKSGWRPPAPRRCGRSFMKTDFGIYVHFPYCLSKCPYCDFASRAEQVIPQERYTEAVLRELVNRSVEFSDREAISIYFGGGTPSLWDPPQLGRVLREIRSLWRVRDAAEVTLEANPGTTDEARFSAFRELGINRLSIGVQSFAPAQLVSLGRKHSPTDAVRAYQTARKAGFANVSLDLIHGAEAQTPAGAARDAAAAVALRPEHISCYALTLTGLAEEVPMAKAVKRGEIQLPGDESVEEMGDAVRAELSKGGYQRYEISNYAQPGFGSVHNSLYWRGGEYAAAGCGACGFSRIGNGGRRYANDRSPERYMERVEATGTGESSSETVGANEHLRERLFTGLRLAQGLDLAALERDLDLPVRALYAAKIKAIVDDGLGELAGAVLRLNDRGLDLHTEVSLRFF